MRWQFLKQLIAELGGGIWRPYTYCPDDVVLTNVGAGLVQSFSLNVKDARPFIWTDAMFTTNNAAVQSGVDTLNGGILIKFDPENGIGQGGNKYVPLRSLFGVGNSAEGPRELVYPIVIAGNDTLAGSLQNISGGNVTVMLSFIGLKRIG